jgi:hypothetical protein
VETYILVIDPDLEYYTVRVENVDPQDTKVGLHNLSEWIESTELGRYEFAPDKALWFHKPSKPDLNIIATGLVGGKVALHGTVAITTWTRRGIDAKGLQDSELVEVWGWVEEIVAYNKMYMHTKDLTLPQLQTFIQTEIEGDGNGI